LIGQQGESVEMNEEDRVLLEKILDEVRELSRNLDRLMAHFGIGPGQFTMTINPHPFAPRGNLWDGDAPVSYPYRFPGTTGGQP
jgi:hypothetical protein